MPTGDGITDADLQLTECYYILEAESMVYGHN
jgi:hypothetical protein